MSEGILTRMLKPDPCQRPSMRMLLEDEWLREPIYSRAFDLREAVLKLRPEILADRLRRKNKGKNDVPDKDFLRGRRQGSFNLKGEASAAYQRSLSDNQK